MPKWIIRIDDINDTLGHLSYCIRQKKTHYIESDKEEEAQQKKCQYSVRYVDIDHDIVVRRWKIIKIERWKVYNIEHNGKKEWVAPKLECVLCTLYSHVLCKLNIHIWFEIVLFLLMVYNHKRMLGIWTTIFHCLSHLLTSHFICTVTCPFL